jgi:hypothetical protein
MNLMADFDALPLNCGWHFDFHDDLALIISGEKDYGWSSHEDLPSIDDIRRANKKEE